MRRANPARDGIVSLTRGSAEVVVGGRGATIQGELLVRTRGEPDFVAYRKQVGWDDGATVSDEEREWILQALLASSVNRRLRIEIV